MILAVGLGGSILLSGPVGASEPLLTTDPCSEPLGWQIDGVDPRFGLGEAEAEAVLAEAVGLWNEAAGRTLLTVDPDRGSPVRFVFDERHDRIQALLPRMAEVEEMAGAIEDERERVEEEQHELWVFRQEHERRLTTLERRREEHERQVEYWESRGDASDDVRRELERVAEELERERLAVNQEGARITERAREVNREVERLNERMDAFNREHAEVEAEARRVRVRSGHYQESRRTMGRWTVSTEREIYVWQFNDRTHLVRVLAHELGHALGLEHVDEPGAVMHSVTDTGGARLLRGVGETGDDADGLPAGPGLHPAELALVRALCSEAEGRSR